jgi:hypothetical protein
MSRDDIIGTMVEDRFDTRYIEVADLWSQRYGNGSKQTARALSCVIGRLVDEATKPLHARLENSDGVPHKTTDPAVDHPSYYGGKDNTYEHIKVVEAWGLGYALGNATKYIARAGKKGSLDDAVTDLKKAEFYVRYEREQFEKELKARNGNGKR